MSGKKEGDELTGKIDISGAGLKEEKKPIVEEKEQEEEEEEEQETEKVKFSETKKGDEDEEYEINFNNQDDVEKFTKTKTKDSENKNEKHFGDEKLEDIQKEISEAERKANDIDPETFYDVADFIMTLVDGSLASGLKWWTKDSSESAYSLPKPKKEKLTKQLAKILIKYNAKFSIELMFIIGLIIMYIPAFRLARARKKEIEELNAKITPVQIIKPVVQNNTTATPVVETPIVNTEPDVVEEKETHKPIKKRPNHRPRKP